MSTCRGKDLGGGFKEDLGSGYATGYGGKGWFDGKEIDDALGLKHIGKGYATNQAGVLLYKGEQIDGISRLRQIEHLDDDWSRCDATKYLYRGELMTKEEARRRGCEQAQA